MDKNFPIVQHQKLSWQKRVPIIVFCYHKGGFTLLNKVFRQVSEENGWKLSVQIGKQAQLPMVSDVIIWSHPVVNLNNVKIPFIGVHFIRDPRDIIVSGYLYHCRTKEAWCVNTDFSLTPPIMFPRVPMSQQYRSEDWKINYIKSLENKSYQSNISNLPQYEGLLFEMNNYGAWTINKMQEWDYSRDNILEVKFEDLMANYDLTFQSVFEYLNFSKAQIESALNIVTEHDLGRKSDEEIAKMDHVFSRKTTKWRSYFEQGHKTVFLDKFGEALINLGYETSNTW